MIGILALSIATYAAADPVVLRYKLHSGENLQYAVSSVADFAFPDKEGTRNVSIDANLLMIENVGKVDSSGLATVETRYSDPHLVLNGKEIQLKAGAGAYSAITRMTAAGKVQNETILNANSNPVASIDSHALSLADVLPSGTVHVGASWGAGTKFKYRLAAIKMQDGHQVAYLEAEGTSNLGAVLKGIKQKNQSGLTGSINLKSEFKFDVERGIMLSVTTHGTMKLLLPEKDPLTKATTNLLGAGRLETACELVGN